MINAYIVVKKYDDTFPFWNKLIEKAYFLNLPIEQIIKEYCGFEGTCLKFLEKENIFEKKLTLTEEYVEILNNKKKSTHILYLNTQKNYPPNLFTHNFIFLGYEYGFFQDKFNYYSSIFHEILFGFIEELLDYKKFLNKSLLFHSYEVAEEYAKLHHTLLEEKKDVEIDQEMSIYEIWKLI